MQKHISSQCIVWPSASLCCSARQLLLLSDYRADDIKRKEEIDPLGFPFFPPPPLPLLHLLLSLLAYYECVHIYVGMQTTSTVYTGIFDTSSNIGKQQSYLEKKKRLRLCLQQELEQSTSAAEVSGSCWRNHSSFRTAAAAATVRRNHQKCLNWIVHY